MYYRILLKGHLDPGWQERLGGLQIVHEPMVPPGFRGTSQTNLPSMACSRNSDI